MVARSLAEIAGDGERRLSQERHWVPDGDTGDVEERVHDRYLDGLLEIGGLTECGDDASECCADVGAEREWKHALKRDDSHSYQWHKARREH